ncbi:FAD:protein FMN transferase [Thorsellia anophelis]|uniref:FAD:protein FMN transferase n=1 Tax=Thorsellia anophelis DSM 18579 TaxID=1123402 RepID=A0A1I0EC86_9GAMM|nr:FAD:protein FMN transferase [Thorsellia anophelis]SET42880.1 thiamine biosynthesis lipoprotein [Thorsellia anophelis DSM 18579]
MKNTTPSNSCLYTFESQMMGSTIQIKTFSDEKVLIKNIFRIIKHYENVLTVNRLNSQIMMVNSNAGVGPIKVDKDIYALVKQAKNASILPNSLFNLAIGPLVKLWKIGFKGQNLPLQKDIQEKLSLISPFDVILDDDENSIFLAKPRMEIDLGAIAKGFIADIVREYAIDNGIAYMLINLGGNIHTLSPNDMTYHKVNSHNCSDIAKTDNHFDGWSIGLKKPFTESEFIGTFCIFNQSVVTSGVYERYFHLNNKLYHHILCSQTGYPVENDLLSVTVFSNSSIDGEIWSTILFGLGAQEGIKVIQTLNGIDAIFVTRDEKIYLSQSNLSHFKLLDTSYHIHTFT